LAREIKRFEDNHAKSRELTLMAMHSAENFWDMKAVAEFLVVAFYDRTQAGLKMKEGIKKIEKTTEWLYCAETWRKIGANDNTVKKCLAKAEQSANQSLDWSACGIAWKDLFNDDIKAKSFLTIAEKHAKTQTDKEQCAMGWKMLNIVTNKGR
jgi:hypothetical protein